MQDALIGWGWTKKRTEKEKKRGDHKKHQIKKINKIQLLWWRNNQEKRNYNWPEQHTNQQTTYRKSEWVSKWASECIITEHRRPHCRHASPHNHQITPRSPKCTRDLRLTVPRTTTHPPQEQSRRRLSREHEASYTQGWDHRKTKTSPPPTPLETSPPKCGQRQVLWHPEKGLMGKLHR